MRIAILQFEGVHEEIVPSLVHALGPGVEVDVFLNRRCVNVRGDLFPELAGMTGRVEYVTIEAGSDWHALGDRIDAGRYDALAVSTFQRESPAVFCQERGLPVLGVVHNVPMFMKSPACRAMLDSGTFRPLVLAPHVAAWFHALTRGNWADRLGVMAPVWWGEQVAAPPPDTEPRRIVIPGGVNFQARGFAALLDALGKGAASALRQAGAQVQVLGGGGDRAQLESAVAAGGFGDVLTLAPLGPNGRVLYDEYIAALRRAWALHPLTPVARADYRQFKITSAVPTSVGFRLPMVMDRWTAAVYPVPAVVADADPAAGLQALLALQPADVSRLRAELTLHAARTLAANRADVARMLAQILPGSAA